MIKMCAKLDSNLVTLFCIFQRSVSLVDVLNEPVYIGPFVVVCKLSPLTLQIQADRLHTTKKVHHNKLKKYREIIQPRGLLKLPKKKAKQTC